MIGLCDDCEYTVLIADLIEVLASVGNFTLKIWLTGVELPFIFDSNCDFHFLQEGVRVDKNGDIMYIFYDMISYVRVVNEVKGLAN